ncbi:MAG: hypothetical protein M3P47_00905 [Pseudomonadota bacterium]|jgi:hypothetical protein|nr:hypothetical protein [Pseudomonadota bacterium]
MAVITEKELTELLIGIVNTQVAIIHALKDQKDYHAVTKVVGSVGVVAGIEDEGTTGGQDPVRPPMTLSTLPAHLVLRALSARGSFPQNMEQLAHQEIGKLFNKP